MSEDMGRSNGHEGPRRSCDQCRIRKVRCDREYPCSNCKLSHRKCSSIGMAQKPRVATQRVLISQQYERKIDTFDARLVGIEGMLKDLKTSLKRDDTVPVTTAPSFTDADIRPYMSPHAAIGRVAREKPQSDEEADGAFEGNSSMSAHTVLASEFLEQAVTKTSQGRQPNPDIQRALASLRQLVRRKGVSKESKFYHQKPMPQGGLTQLPLPSMTFVLVLLREIKSSVSMTMLMNCTFTTVDHFVEACRKVYFATEEYSISTFITVNTGLYYLFQEKAAIDDSKREEYLKCHYICRDNIETALANLPLLLPAKRDSVEALLFGVTYCIDISKMSVAWTLNCIAASLCQTLGWHRLRDTPKDLEDTRAGMFWFCYMIDKGLSLRFGRSPIIQEWDISTPRCFGNIQITEPWKSMVNAWLKTGLVAGEIYQNLYSPFALSRPTHQRIETARNLIEKMEDIWNEMEGLTLKAKYEQYPLTDPPAIDSKKEAERKMLEMMSISGQVNHSATLTLIYCAIPSAPGFPGAFNTECIEAARTAFKYHKACMEFTSNDTPAVMGYLNWTILYSPFTPFIVLFCHVIETSSMEDLQRLNQFTDTLQASTSISPAIDKLYRLCKLLCKVATMYVETKSDQQQDHDMSTAGNDFDSYLSQLGFMYHPSNEVAMASNNNNSGPADTAAMTGNQTQELGDWFSGNTYFMGLMEEDFWDFDPMN